MDYHEEKGRLEIGLKAAIDLLGAKSARLEYEGDYAVNTSQSRIYSGAASYLQKKLDELKEESG